MPPKKKKAKKGSSKEPKKKTAGKKDKSPKKGGKSKSPAKGKGGKKGAKKGKENKPESDSEEEEPPPPTERELWLADGGILPQMTCGAEDLLRYELLKHDEAALSNDIEARPQFSTCNGYSLNWLPDVNQKWQHPARSWASDHSGRPPRYRRRCRQQTVSYQRSPGRPPDTP